MSSQLQELRLGPGQISPGGHAAVRAGVCYHQTQQRFSSGRPENQFILTDSVQPAAQRE